MAGPEAEGRGEGYKDRPLWPLAAGYKQGSRTWHHLESRGSRFLGSAPRASYPEGQVRWPGTRMVTAHLGRYSNARLVRGTNGLDRLGDGAMVEKSKWRSSSGEPGLEKGEPVEGQEGNGQTGRGNATDTGNELRERAFLPPFGTTTHGYIIISQYYFCKDTNVLFL